MASKTGRTSRRASISRPALRAEIIDLCNQQLADTADLQSQIKQAHWNVKGPEFIALAQAVRRSGRGGRRVCR